RSEDAVCAGDVAPVWPEPDPSRLRPILLLAAPEPAEVVALLPDGPPRRMRWRGATHAISCLQGPERIANEWWREAPPATAAKQHGGAGHGQARTDRTYAPTTGQIRDYFLAEDDAGRRFWMFCEVGHVIPPRWFVHGLFA